MSKTKNGDPNVQAAIEASEKFIREHSDVPTVDVPRVGEGVTPPQATLPKLVPGEICCDCVADSCGIVLGTGRCRCKCHDFVKVTPPSPEPPTKHGWLDMAAENIAIVVDKWLQKMTLPTTNKAGRDLFRQAMHDVIESAYSKREPVVSQGQAQTPKHELAETEHRNAWTYIHCTCGVVIGPVFNADYARDEFDLHCAKAQTPNSDPNVQAAIEASAKFIAEHPDVPTVDVAQVEGQAQTPKPRNWRDLYDKLPPERRAKIEAEVMKDLAELKLIDRCAYESAAWRCVKEQGHEGGHSPFLEDGECQTAQVEGQAEPPSQLDTAIRLLRRYFSNERPEGALSMDYDELTSETDEFLESIDRGVSPTAAIDQAGNQMANELEKIADEFEMEGHRGAAKMCRQRIAEWRAALKQGGTQS